MKNNKFNVDDRDSKDSVANAHDTNMFFKHDYEN